MDDLADDNGDSLGDISLATAADLNAELLKHGAVVNRVDAGIAPKDRGSYWIRDTASLHAEAQEVFSTNRALHNALLDIAWCQRKVP